MLVMAGLPDEITTEIFLRLPAKSLVRFRCASRFWSSLLTSTSFVEACSDRSSRLGCQYLLKYKRNDSSRVGIHDSGSRLLSNLYPSFDLNNDTYELVGLSNGIPCLSTHDENDYTRSEIFLWNPSTNERRCLPQPPLFRVGTDRFRVLFLAERRPSWRFRGGQFNNGMWVPHEPLLAGGGLQPEAKFLEADQRCVPLRDRSHVLGQPSGLRELRMLVVPIRRVVGPVRCG